MDATKSDLEPLPLSRTARCASRGQYESAIAAGLHVTVGFGYGWREWGIPPEWKAPFTGPTRVQCKKHTFIYALVDEVTQEVGYVGKSDDPEQRLVDHLILQP